MSKKYYIWGSIALLTVSLLLAGWYWYTVTESKVVSPLTPTPTPTPEDTNMPTSFIILPHGYVPKENEQALLDTRLANSERIIVNLETSEIQAPYTKCEKDTLAKAKESAQNNIKRWYLQKEQCSTNGAEKVLVYEIRCDGSPTSCLDTIPPQGQEVDVPIYLFFSNTPLFLPGTRPTIQTENPYPMTYIITWSPSLSGVEAQSSYSIEILQNDESPSREYASGKIDSNIQGDYYIPLTPPTSENNSYRVRLRQWYSDGVSTTRIPFISEKTFTIENAVPLSQSTDGSDVAEMAWIPEWGHPAGIESVEKTPQKWHTISPVWYFPNKDGTLKTVAKTNDPTLTSLVKKNNIRLVPTISLFDADILSEILNKNMDTHIKTIVDAVVQGGYHGIDLDYESTYEADKPLLLTFVQKLSLALHEKNKMLSFTVLPKIDDRKIYAFLPQTHEAQDWAVIGQNVDEFRIMAYDYTGQGSSRPGPLSPIIWNEALIKYALTKMPAEKIVLALPLYSHAWPKPAHSNLPGVNNDVSLSSGAQKNTTSWQHDDIAYIKSHSVYYREKVDTWNKEVYAELSYKGVERIQYHLDKNSIDARKALAKKYGIKGVCYWRIGGETL